MRAWPHCLIQPNSRGVLEGLVEGSLTLAHRSLCCPTGQKVGELPPFGGFRNRDQLRTPSATRYVVQMVWKGKDLQSQGFETITTRFRPTPCFWKLVFYQGALGKSSLSKGCRRPFPVAESSCRFGCWAVLWADLGNVPSTKHAPKHVCFNMLHVCLVRGIPKKQLSERDPRSNRTAQSTLQAQELLRDPQAVQHPRHPLHPPLHPPPVFPPARKGLGASVPR